MSPATVEPAYPSSGDEAGLPETTDNFESDGEERSLIEDVEALIDDGKTYLEAEIAFQKSRAAFVADRAKGIVVLGALAAAFVLLALVALTVGLVIALTPLLTAWGATAVVVGLLLLAAFGAVRSAGKRWSALMATFTDPGDGA